MLSQTLRHPLRSPKFQTLTGITLGLSLTTLHQCSSRKPHRLDSFASSSSGSGDGAGLFSKRLVKRGGGLDAGVVKEVSNGSVCGVLTGLLVSVFSRTLAVLIGLLIVGVQYLSLKGINIVPTTKLQHYFKSIDFHALVQDNAAFKISFGTTFALAAFAKF